MNSRRENTRRVMVPILACYAAIIPVALLGGLALADQIIASGNPHFATSRHLGHFLLGWLLVASSLFTIFQLIVSPSWRRFILVAWCLLLAAAYLCVNF